MRHDISEILYHAYNAERAQKVKNGTFNISVCGILKGSCVMDMTRVVAIQTYMWVHMMGFFAKDLEDSQNKNLVNG